MHDLGELAHLNTCFKHFLYFTLHYKLVEERDMAPLQELIDSFLGRTSQAAAPAPT